MRVITAGIILTTSCLFVALTGCQMGKSPLASLAWWQKDDELASRYIEPPSHQFTPSDSAVVSDDPNLPPLPPDIEKTVDSFEQEVARSYRELARESEKAGDRLVGTAREVKEESKNMLMPAERKPPTSADFANPLTPRPSERYALNESAPKSSNSLQPKPTGTSGTGGFQPDGMTQYEKLAQQSLQPKDPGTFSPSRPEARLPNASLPMKRGNKNDFAFTPKSPANKIDTTTPLQPSRPNKQPVTEAQQVNFEYPSTPYQSFQPRGKNTTSTNASQMPNPASLTEQLVDTDSDSASNVVDATKDAVGNLVPDLSPKAPAGLSLQLQGQGSYAPGSIRAPNPIDPAELVLPPATGSGSR